MRMLSNPDRIISDIKTFGDKDIGVWKLYD